MALLTEAQQAAGYQPKQNEVRARLAARSTVFRGRPVYLFEAKTRARGLAGRAVLLWATPNWI